MVIDFDTGLVFGAIVLASFARSAFGFGDALVAMPILAASLSLKVATPLVALAGGTTAIGILLTRWRDLSIKSVARLVLSSALGIPIGLYLLRGSHDDILKLVLGITITSFALYCLLRRDLMELRGEKASYGFGFVAGVLGGAYNTSGPPIAIYGTLKRWDRQCFRANLQGYYLVASLMAVSGHLVEGNITDVVGRYYLVALPAIAVGVAIGGWQSKRLSKDRFTRYIYGFTAIVGALLCIRSVIVLLSSTSEGAVR